MLPKLYGGIFPSIREDGQQHVRGKKAFEVSAAGSKSPSRIICHPVFDKASSGEESEKAGIAMNKQYYLSDRELSLVSGQCANSRDGLWLYGSPC